jgi:hypothetical protein
MTEEHLTALLATAEAKKDSQGWAKTPEGRLITLYVASGGAALSVSRIDAVRVKGSLLEARTVKGETYLVAVADVYAASVDAPVASGRKAGFV